MTKVMATAIVAMIAVWRTMFSKLLGFVKPASRRVTAKKRNRMTKPMYTRYWRQSTRMLCCSRALDSTVQLLLGPDIPAIDLAHDSAIAKHQQSIANGEQLDQLRRDNDDPLATIRQRADDPQDLCLCLDIDAGSRLVHDQDLGLHGQPFADDDFLLIAAGEEPHGGSDRARLDAQVFDDRSCQTIATTIIDDPAVIQPVQ